MTQHNSNRGIHYVDQTMYEWKHTKPKRHIFSKRITWDSSKNSMSLLPTAGTLKIIELSHKCWKKESKHWIDAGRFPLSRKYTMFRPILHFTLVVCFVLVFGNYSMFTQLWLSPIRTKMFIFVFFLFVVVLIIAYPSSVDGTAWILLCLNFIMFSFVSFPIRD